MAVLRVMLHTITTDDPMVTVTVEDPMVIITLSFIETDVT